MALLITGSQLTTTLHLQVESTNDNCQIGPHSIASPSSDKLCGRTKNARKHSYPRNSFGERVVSVGRDYFRTGESNGAGQTFRRRGSAQCYELGSLEIFGV